MNIEKIKNIDKVVNDLNLKPGMLSILTAVYENSNELNQSTICKKSGMKPARVSRLVYSLSKKGLVEQRESVKRNENIIVLTNKGFSTLELLTIEEV